MSLEKMGGHYSQNHIEDDDAWELLKGVFHDKTEYSMNWLFLSTSGVHGTYTKLDGLDEVREEMREEGDDSPPTVTFLLLKPRLVQVCYGNVPIRNDDDIQWLKVVVKKTLEAVEWSQNGNV